MNNLYYTAPDDAIFNEVQLKAMQLWLTYDDTYGYASEKNNQIKDITNIKDNVMWIVGMFDNDNQRKLSTSLSPEARQAICDRLTAGGTPAEYNNFL